MANVALKDVAAAQQAPLKARMTDRLAKLVSKARYSAPKVVSFPLNSLENAGQTSMIGNNTADFE